MEDTKTQIDFQKLFEAVPGLYLVLKPDTPTLPSWVQVMRI